MTIKDQNQNKIFCEDENIQFNFLGTKSKFDIFIGTKNLFNPTLNVDIFLGYNLNMEKANQCS